MAGSEQSPKIDSERSNIGNQILTGLKRLKAKHNLIGDVRSKGLLPGMELAKDRGRKEPATSECAQVLGDGIIAWET